MRFTTILLRFFLPLVGLLLLIGFAYYAAPENDFYLDDFGNIVDASAIHIPELTFANLAEAARDALLPSRPLANMTFAFDWWRGNGDPRPFQWTNLVIHGAAAGAVFAFLILALRRIGHRPGVTCAAAFFGAALWACHPIEVQAVTYIVQRMTSLAALFTLLTVIFYLLARTSDTPRHGIGFAVLAGVAFLFAMGSKENAVIAPFLVLLAEYGFCRQDRVLARTKIDYILLALLAAVLIYVTIDILSGAGPLAHRVADGYANRPFTLGERLLTQPRVVGFYLSQVVWPLPGRFSLAHDFTVSTGLFSPPSTAAALAGVVLWCAFGVWALFRVRWRVVGFFLLWVPATLAIESTILPLEMVFEHRMYLPMVGIAGLAALGIAQLLERPVAVRAVAAVVLVALPVLLSISTGLRVPLWRDPAVFWQDATEHAPQSARTWGHLGVVLAHRDRWDEAETAFSRALAIDPEEPFALEFMAVRLMDTGDLPGAERLLSRRLMLGDINHKILNTLGELRFKQGDFRSAVQYFQRAASEDESVPAYPYNLALAHERLGECGVARRHFLAYLRFATDESRREAVRNHLAKHYDSPGGSCYR
jgi:hypothetical protein